MTTKTTSSVSSYVLKHKSRRNKYIHVIEVSTFSSYDGVKTNHEKVVSCCQWIKIKDGWSQKNVTLPEDISSYDVLTMCALSLIKSSY